MEKYEKINREILETSKLVSPTSRDVVIEYSKNVSFLQICANYMMIVGKIW